MNNKLLKYRWLVVFILLISVIVIDLSCTKHVVDPVCTQTLPKTISFSKHILPILNANCNSSDCHSGNSPAGFLDLSSSVAYSKLMKKGSGYVDTINPSNSILYTQITSSMPPSGKMDPCNIDMILKWIEQKAKNN